MLLSAHDDKLVYQLLELDMNKSTLNLDNIRMSVIITAENGVVNRDTIFSFSHENEIVTAAYKGGKIIQGYLVGTMIGDKLEFCYCQLQAGGSFNYGRSSCFVERGDDGKLILTENFKSLAHGGEGINVFRQI